MLFQEPLRIDAKPRNTEEIVWKLGRLLQVVVEHISKTGVGLVGHSVLDPILEPEIRILHSINHCDFRGLTSHVDFEASKFHSRTGRPVKSPSTPPVPICTWHREHIDDGCKDHELLRSGRPQPKTLTELTSLSDVSCRYKHSK